MKITDTLYQTIYCFVGLHKSDQRWTNQLFVWKVFKALRINKFRWWVKVRGSAIMATTIQSWVKTVYIVHTIRMNLSALINPKFLPKSSLVIEGLLPKRVDLWSFVEETSEQDNLAEAGGDHENNVEDWHQVDSLKVVLHYTSVLQVRHSYQILKEERWC